MKGGLWLGCNKVPSSQNHPEFAAVVEEMRGCLLSPVVPRGSRSKLTRAMMWADAELCPGLDCLDIFEELVGGGLHPI
jgi:hypothetical protein